MSPVPGGRSTINTSSLPQTTCVISCCNAPMIIGPRQITASSSFSISPIDIIVTPCACNGSMSLPSGLAGRLVTPIMRGCEGPYISASSSPTLRPCRAKATARFEATVDLPTPPLPLAIARIRSTPDTRCGPPCCGVGCWPIFKLGAAGFAAGPCAVITTCTELIPGSARSAASTAFCVGVSARAASGVGASITNRICASSTLSARIKSRLTRSLPSGVFTAATTFRTSSRVTVMCFSIAQDLSSNALTLGKVLCFVAKGKSRLTKCANIQRRGC